MFLMGKLTVSSFLNSMATIREMRCLPELNSYKAAHDRNIEYMNIIFSTYFE